jgi:Cys-rich repeat protein
MDDRRFDALTRWMGTSQTRRGALRAVTGSALGGALGLRALREAAALKTADSACSNGSQCDSGVCIKYGKCKKDGRLTGKCRCGCTATDCPSGKTCRNGACFRDCLTPTTCTPNNIEVCNRKKDCLCFATDLGTSCMSGGDNNCDVGCTTSLDCPTGQVCMDFTTCAPLTGCQEKFCVNPCGLGAKDPTTSSTSPSSAQRSQPRQEGLLVDFSDLGR